VCCCSALCRRSNGCLTKADNKICESLIGKAEAATALLPSLTLGRMQHTSIFKSYVMAPKTPKLTAFCRTFALSNKSIQGWVSTHTERLTHILHTPAVLQCSPTASAFPKLSRTHTHTRKPSHHKTFNTSLALTILCLYGQIRCTCIDVRNGIQLCQQIGHGIGHCRNSTLLSLVICTLFGVCWFLTTDFVWKWD
jgi:hypothetical protein